MAVTGAGVGYYYYTQEFMQTRKPEVVAKPEVCDVKHNTDRE